MLVSKPLVTSTSYPFVSKLPNFRCILKLFDLPRLIYDLIQLSIKITIAMILATYRIFLPPSMKNLSGETVLITGAGHGVGRELAIQLAALGCTVVCWDIDEDANKTTMNTIVKAGREVFGFVLDVSKRLEVRQTVRMMRRVGIPEITILINNAAMLLHRPLLSHDPDDIERTFSINVLSNFWTIEAFLPAMLQNDKGHVVSMCSMCGIYGVSEKVPYCSSKFAVRGLMEALREELRLNLKKRQIHFTTIYPFYVDTGLAKDPKYRFPYIFGAVTPNYAAQEVIKAIRRNYTEYSIPRCLFFLNSVNRIVPETVMILILDFLACIERKQREKS